MNERAITAARLGTLLNSRVSAVDFRFRAVPCLSWFKQTESTTEHTKHRGTENGSLGKPTRYRRWYSHLNPFSLFPFFTFFLQRAKTRPVIEPAAGRVGLSGEESNSVRAYGKSTSRRPSLSAAGRLMSGLLIDQPHSSVREPDR